MSFLQENGEISFWVFANVDVAVDIPFNFELKQFVLLVGKQFHAQRYILETQKSEFAPSDSFPFKKVLDFSTSILSFYCVCVMLCYIIVLISGIIHLYHYESRL